MVAATWEGEASPKLSLENIKADKKTIPEKEGVGYGTEP